MRWTSWAEFWAMGGYAVYVWGSFAMTAFLMAVEVWQARRQRSNTLTALRRERDLLAHDAEHPTLPHAKDVP
ncbi:MAG: heme exporter protein CcmD [Betaproteobacteria bacterium]|nr:heme exporter protein CcmD [Betaproteobacteria bacterium]